MQVKVARIDVAGWRAAQLLASLAVAAGVIARRWGDPIFQIGVGVFYLNVLRAFVRAYRRLGRRDLQVLGGTLRLSDVEIARSSVESWVIDGTVARLYGSEVSWKLEADVADEAILQPSLARLFGAPLPFKRRSNGIGAAVSFVGLALLAFGVGSNDPRFGLAGGMVFSIALPSWYAYLRKIVRQSPRRHG
jgi:hypothetical protein